MKTALVNVQGPSFSSLLFTCKTLQCQAALRVNSAVSTGGRSVAKHARPEDVGEDSRKHGQAAVALLCRMWKAAFSK